MGYSRTPSRRMTDDSSQAHCLAGAARGGLGPSAAKRFAPQSGLQRESLSAADGPRPPRAATTEDCSHGRPLPQDRFEVIRDPEGRLRPSALPRPRRRASSAGDPVQGPRAPVPRSQRRGRNRSAGRWRCGTWAARCGCGDYRAHRLASGQLEAQSERLP